MAIAPKTTSSEDRKAGVDRAFREGQGPTKIGGPPDPPVKVAPPLSLSERRERDRKALGLGEEE